MYLFDLRGVAIGAWATLHPPRLLELARDSGTYAKLTGCMCSVECAVCSVCVQGVQGKCTVAWEVISSAMEEGEDEVSGVRWKMRHCLLVWSDTNKPVYWCC